MFQPWPVWALLQPSMGSVTAQTAMSGHCSSPSKWRRALFQPKHKAQSLGTVPAQANGAGTVPAQAKSLGTVPAQALVCGPSKMNAHGVRLHPVSSFPDQRLFVRLLIHMKKLQMNMPPDYAEPLRPIATAPYVHSTHWRVLICALIFGVICVIIHMSRMICVLTSFYTSSNSKRDLHLLHDADALQEAQHRLLPVSMPRRKHLLKEPRPPQDQ